MFSSELCCAVWEVYFLMDYPHSFAKYFGSGVIVGLEVSSDSELFLTRLVFFLLDRDSLYPFTCSSRQYRRARVALLICCMARICALFIIFFDTSADISCSHTHSHLPFWVYSASLSSNWLHSDGALLNWKKLVKATVSAYNLCIK